MEEVKELGATEEEAKKINLPHTIKLKCPVIVGSREVSEIVFKHPLRAGMTRNLPVSEEQIQRKHLTSMICAMTEESSVVIEQLVYADYERVLGVVIHFLQGGV